MATTRPRGRDMTLTSIRPAMGWPNGALHGGPTPMPGGSDRWRAPPTSNPTGSPCDVHGAQRADLRSAARRPRRTGLQGLRGVIARYQQTRRPLVRKKTVPRCIDAADVRRQVESTLLFVDPRGFDVPGIVADIIRTYGLVNLCDSVAFSEYSTIVMHHYRA